MSESTEWALKVLGGLIFFGIGIYTLTSYNNYCIGSIKDADCIFRTLFHLGLIWFFLFIGSLMLLNTFKELNKDFLQKKDNKNA